MEFNLVGDFVGHEMCSVPVNKEIMRIYKDLKMVEQLGSGVPRILKAYSKDCFKFTNNFLRMSFPIDERLTLKDTEQVAEQVLKLLTSIGKGSFSGSELMKS